MILVGSTRTGKTSWARSLGPHIHWAGYYNLKQFNPSVNYIVFDDMKITESLMWKQWLGAQKHFTCTDKYVGKIDITFGKPCIFLCNRDGDPFLNHMLGEDFLDWLRGNTVYIDIGETLFY